MYHGTDVGKVGHVEWIMMCVLWKRFWEMLIYSAKHLLYLLLYRFKLWL